MKMFEQKRASGRAHGQRSAFTLIEMMVVVALVGILIGGVFRLLSAAGEGAKRGETIDRMQRIENALSGFYATYGSYPPVLLHGSADPFVEEDRQGNVTKVADLKAENANRAAACQPMSFEFPPMKALDSYIASEYRSANVFSPNLNPGAFPQDGEWPKVKLYRYGVVSFLVPRYDAIGDFEFRKQGGKYTAYASDSDLAPHEDLYKNHRIWKDANPADQAKAQRDACARWLPNLRGLIRGGRKLMEVNTGAPYHDNELTFSENNNPERAYVTQGGSKYILRKMTIQDAWDRDFYYYSAPPYQSYRLWSAGPDGNTFPANYPLLELDAAKRKIVGGWIRDDIARPSR